MHSQAHCKTSDESTAEWWRSQSSGAIDQTALNTNHKNLLSVSCNTDVKTRHNLSIMCLLFCSAVDRPASEEATSQFTQFMLCPTLLSAMHIAVRNTSQKCITYTYSIHNRSQNPKLIHKNTMTTLKWPNQWNTLDGTYGSSDWWK